MLGDIARDVLDKGSLPEFQKFGLGTVIQEQGVGQVCAFSKDMAVAFSEAAAPLFVAPFAMVIIDIIVEGRATSANGTVKVLKATDEICTAIACAVDGTVSHLSAGATEATKARRVLAKGDVINVQATGDDATATRGRVTVLAVRL